MNREEIEVALRLFGAELDTAFDEIKRKYKNLAQVFHPDKYEAGSARQKWAADKLVALNGAYSLLKEFYAQYPDGPPQSWFEAKQSSNDPAGPGETADGDGYFEWEHWQEKQDRTSSNENSESQWQKEQELRRSELRAAERKTNREKYFFYGKLGAIAFIAFIWLGRIGAMEATKIMAANEHQAIIEQQKYEQARQGTNIDDFIWSANDLSARHQEQFDQLKEKNQKRSVDIWTSGLTTTAATLLVLWVCLQSALKKVFSLGGKNENQSTHEK